MLKHLQWHCKSDNALSDFLSNVTNRYGLMLLLILGKTFSSGKLKSVTGDRLFTIIASENQKPIMLLPPQHCSESCPVHHHPKGALRTYGTNQSCNSYVIVLSNQCATDGWGYTSSCTNITTIHIRLIICNQKKWIPKNPNLGYCTTKLPAVMYLIKMPMKQSISGVAGTDTHQCLWICVSGRVRILIVVD